MSYKRSFPFKVIWEKARKILDLFQCLAARTKRAGIELFRINWIASAYERILYSVILISSILQLSLSFAVNNLLFRPLSSIHLVIHQHLRNHYFPFSELFVEQKNFFFRFIGRILLRILSLRVKSTLKGLNKQWRQTKKRFPWRKNTQLNWLDNALARNELKIYLVTHLFLSCASLSCIAFYDIPWVDFYFSCRSLFEIGCCLNAMWNGNFDRVNMAMCAVQCRFQCAAPCQLELITDIRGFEPEE